MTPDLPAELHRPWTSRRRASLPAPPTPLLPVVLHDNRTDTTGLVHVVLHPPLLGDLTSGQLGADLRWDTRVPATITTLCGITTATDHITVLTHVTGVPCDSCVLVRVLDTLHHPHGHGLTTPAGFGGELRGYTVPGDLARAALRLLTDRATPAPALVDDRAPEVLIVLTVTPFDGPLPWPDSIRAATTLPDLPLPGANTGPVRWQHLPDTARLAGDLELCACLVSAAHNIGHPVSTARALHQPPTPHTTAEGGPCGTLGPLLPISTTSRPSRIAANKTVNERNV